ncbi:hypothetical protein HYU92_06535 [Candidatus Curtissbacteria bacterium]|nr:hypothetical protein [Candidatus Curtissbacteria bacterium]
MIRKGSLTYLLLIALEKTMETGTPLIDFLASPSTFVWTGYRTNLNRSSLYRSIQQLKEKGYLETPKSGRKILLKLTDKGKQEVLLKKLLEDENWDGKWRIVIFDIPEKHRKLRNTLRGKLKEWQFIKWQKSVWASKKDIADQMRKFIKDVGLDDWVKVFIATGLK